MTYRIVPILLFSALHADSWLFDDTVQELKQLLKIKTEEHCAKRHRTAFAQWAKRQAVEPRAVTRTQEEELHTLFSPASTPDALKKYLVQLLNDPLFCDGQYKGQAAQEMIRSLARDLQSAAAMLDGALTKQKVTIPPLAADSLIFMPRSTLAAVFADYLVNNVPDLSAADINKTNQLLEQLLKMAEQQEPAGKNLRNKVAEQIIYYNKQLVPRLYNNDYAKRAKEIIPTVAEYKHARDILAQNQRVPLPRTLEDQIQAWRVRAADFLKSNDYEPKQYPDPELQYIVTAMAEDIRAAAQIIKAYLERMPTNAIFHNPSLVDPAVHARIKEIIKAIPTKDAMQLDKAGSKNILQAQQTAIGALPSTYQQALQQYINIADRLALLQESAQPAAPVASATSAATTIIPGQPVSTAVPVTSTSTSTTPTPEQTAATTAAPAASEQAAAVPTPEAIAPVSAATPAAAESTATPSAPVSETLAAAAEGTPAAAAASTASPTAATTLGTEPPDSIDSLTAALETAGQVKEIAVSKLQASPSAAAAATAAAPASSGGGVQTSFPAAPAISTGSSVAATGGITAAVAAPSATLAAVTTAVSEQTAPATSAPATPAAPAPASTPVPESMPTAPTTPSTPTTAPSSPATPTATESNGPSVQDSLRDLQNQLMQIKA